MENLYVPLLVAGASGLTFVSYNHPELFLKAFLPKLLWVSGFVIVVVVAYDAGVSSAFREVADILKSGLGEETELAKQKAKTPEFSFLFALALFVFSSFLAWFSDHMKRENSLSEESDS